MPHFRLCFALLVAVLALAPVAIRPAFAGDIPIQDTSFERTWNRTDLPVAEGVVARTWVWGAARSESISEPYAESPDGRRNVRYFDKSRMEITHPDGDPDTLWHVTNGLLVVELIRGEMQVGDDEFVARFPSEIPVAGDNIAQNGPSYATFHGRIEPADERGDEPITQRLDWQGGVNSDPELEARGVHTAFYDEVVGHNIAAPFWEFMNSSGTIWDAGEFVDGLLFPNPFYATGRPITEPYWSDVTVAGTEKLLLIQCFERRCLTYTPDNPEGWQVEAGNVGLHYHQWRYARSSREGTVLIENQGNLLAVRADGTTTVNLTADLDLFASEAAWSPDGSRIAFVGSGDRLYPEPGTIFVVNVDGSGLEQVTAGPGDSGPSWSPDGTRLVFDRVIAARGSNSDDLFAQETQLFVVDLDAASEWQLTDIPRETNFSISESPAWSPTGEWIAFSNANGIAGPSPLDSTIYLVRPDGSDLIPLAKTQGDAQLVWSPDGERLAYERQRGGSWDFHGRHIWYVQIDDPEPVDVAGGDGIDPDNPVWSPSGDSIFFSPGAGRNFVVSGLASYDLATTESTLVAHYGRQPAWSLDGNTLAVVARGGIVLMNADGSDQVLIYRGGARPQWQPAS